MYKIILRLDALLYSYAIIFIEKRKKWIIENLLNDLMFHAPDKKDLEKIVINRDVVLENSEALMIYSNKQTNQKILANKTWI